MDLDKIKNAKTDAGMNNKEKALFHAFAVNGLVAQKRELNEKISEMVADKIVPSGWIVAYGTFADYCTQAVNEIAMKKIVHTRKLEVRLGMLRDQIENIKSKIAEVITEKVDEIVDNTDNEENEMETVELNEKETEKTYTCPKCGFTKNFYAGWDENTEPKIRCARCIEVFTIELEDVSEPIEEKRTLTAVRKDLADLYKATKKSADSLISYGVHVHKGYEVGVLINGDLIDRQAWGGNMKELNYWIEFAKERANIDDEIEVFVEGGWDWAESVNARAMGDYEPMDEFYSTYVYKRTI